MNAVEHEPVETRVLNPTASEASHNRKQRSYRKMNLKKKVLAPNGPGTEMSSAEMAAPNRRHRNVPDPSAKAKLRVCAYIITRRVREFRVLSKLSIFKPYIYLIYKAPLEPLNTIVS